MLDTCSPIPHNQLVLVFPILEWFSALEQDPNIVTTDMNGVSSLDMSGV